jgi:hypothetical protein
MKHQPLFSFLFPLLLFYNNIQHVSTMAMSAGLPVELVQHSRVLIADHDVAADCHAD